MRHRASPQDQARVPSRRLTVRLSILVTLPPSQPPPPRRASLCWIRAPPLQQRRAFSLFAAEPLFWWLQSALPRSGSALQSRHCARSGVPTASTASVQRPLDHASVLPRCLGERFFVLLLP